MQKSNKFLIGFIDTETGDMGFGGSCGWFWRCLKCGEWFCSGCETCQCGSHDISIEGMTNGELQEFIGSGYVCIQGTFSQWLTIKLRNFILHRKLIKEHGDE